jgi:hypothetical protein
VFGWSPALVHVRVGQKSLVDAARADKHGVSGSQPRHLDLIEVKIMSTLVDRHVDDAVATRHIVERLVAAYTGCRSAGEVERAVLAAREKLSGARVRVFVPIFIERLARETLDRSIRHTNAPAQDS